MSEKRLHIRDVLQMNRHTAELPNITLCGMESTNLKGLVFGAPEIVLQGKGDICEQCRNKWIQERDSDRQQKQLMHKVRVGLHQLLRRGAGIGRSMFTVK